jgi:three-Cys-motif partner protein
MSLSFALFMVHNSFRLLFAMPKVNSKAFFREQRVHSRIKAEIVYKYVKVWAQIVLNPQERYNKLVGAAYIDLFSGPGTYEDGNKSTPLLVIEEAIKLSIVRRNLRSYFNDKNKAHIESLEQEIDNISGITTLTHRPMFYNEEASISLINRFNIAPNVPQFFFLDQFGYSDITPELIRRAFQADKCDCAFFFKYSRVIGALNNPSASANMVELFGKQQVENLRLQLKTRLSALAKEEMILEALKKAMSSVGAPFFHAFPFRIQETQGATHHLIYLGKHERGLAPMKEIMGKASSRQDEGVPSFGFAEHEAHPNLFAVSPIDELQSALLTRFGGETTTVGAIYSAHHPGTPYLLKNYQEALRRLEADGRIVATPIAQNRPTRNGKTTMAPDTRISFPRKDVAN